MRRRKKYDRLFQLHNLGTRDKILRIVASFRLSFPSLGDCRALEPHLKGELQESRPPKTFRSATANCFAANHFVGAMAIRSRARNSWTHRRRSDRAVALRKFGVGGVVADSLSDCAAHCVPMLAKPASATAHDRFGNNFVSDGFLMMPSWWIRLHGRRHWPDDPIGRAYAPVISLSSRLIFVSPSIEFRGHAKAVFTDAGRRRFFERGVPAVPHAVDGALNLRTPARTAAGEFATRGQVIVAMELSSCAWMPKYRELSGTWRRTLRAQRKRRCPAG